MKRREFISASAIAIGDASLGFPIRTGRDWHDWRVSGERVNRFLAELGMIGATPEGGVNRPAFSPEDIEARAYTADLMRSAGLDVATDAAGNLLGSRPGTDRSANPILFGSHIDSVLQGGKYDGDVGSMAAVEVAHVLNEREYANRHPLMVTIWCDEESGLTGSNGFVGLLTEEDLARTNLAGDTLAERIRRIGGDPDRIREAAHAPGSVEAYVELHIEQGAELDESGIQIGVVEGIVGIRWIRVTIRGMANHAGTTPMNRRRNAMLAASDLVLAVDRIVRAEPGRQVGTVGWIEAKPGAPNVIPGEVNLSVELRDLSIDKINMLWNHIRAELEEISARWGTTFETDDMISAEPALSTPAVRDVITDATNALGYTNQLMPSGAGHDAQELARIGPMGMIFVPSVGGISHSPDEFTGPADVTRGANVLLQTVLRIDNGG